MSEPMYQIIELLLRAIVVGIITYLVPIIKQWIQDNRLAKEAITAVNAAQQILTDNQEKKEYAVRYMTDRLNSLGIKLTSEQLDSLIEAAVYTMKQASK